MGNFRLNHWNASSLLFSTSRQSKALVSSKKKKVRQLKNAVFLDVCYYTRTGYYYLGRSSSFAPTAILSVHFTYDFEQGITYRDQIGMLTSFGKPTTAKLHQKPWNTFQCQYPANSAALKSAKEFRLACSRYIPILGKSFFMFQAKVSRISWSGFRLMVSRDTYLQLASYKKS